MEGWIKLHRKIMDWRWFSSPNHYKLWTILLMRATHRESEHRDVKLLPGQLITGRKQLAAWSGFSEQQVRSILDDFRRTSELTIKTTKKFSIITIINWNDYNLSNQENNQQITNNQPTGNQQITTFKNAKNNKNNNTGEFTPEFFEGVIDDPKKILPNVKSKRSPKIKVDKSPLSVLFKPEDEIHEWLTSPGSSLNVQNELLENYSHHVLAEEVKTAFQWQLERGGRNAGLFLKNWLKNKPKKKIYGDTDPLEQLAAQYGIPFDQGASA